MKTPDITPVAIGAFVILVVTNILVLWGIDIGAKREASLEALINGGAVVAFLLHDAIVRHGRAKVAAAKAASASGATVVTNT